MSLSNNPPPVIKYEKRVVAFMDILGFTDLIKEGGHESEIGAVFSHLNYRASQAERISNHGRMQLTVFSDCIVISEELLDGFGALRLAGYAGYLALDLLARGFLVRGGLSTGELYHQDGTVFGPAMIEAYNIENKVAVYPRIVTSQSFMQEFQKGLRSHSDGKMHPQMLLAQMSQFRYDFDGVFHLDIFNPMIPKPEKLLSLVSNDIKPDEKMGLSCINAVRTVRKLRFKPQAAQKYDWMDSYLRDCAKRFNWEHLL